MLNSNELPPPPQISANQVSKSHYGKNTQSYATAKKHRSSSIELLRIVAMLLVLLGHYVPVRMQPTTATAFDQPFSTLLELELNSISFVCVNVFVLISGYFSIRPKRSSLFRFLIQICFWAYFTTLIGWLIWPDTLNIPNGVLSFVVVLRQWFVFSYLGLYMFAPILNSYIDNVNSNKLLKFVGIYYAFSIFFGYFCYGFWGTPKDFLEGMSILSLIGLYFVGAYLRKEENSVKHILCQKSLTYLVIYIALTVIQTLFAFFLLRFGVKSSPYGYLNPVILLESVCLFLFFAKLHMRQVKWINYLASSSFAVYLLHCSPELGSHFTNSFKWIESNVSPALPAALVYMIVIYVVAVLIDKAWWHMLYKIKPIIPI